MAKDPDYSDTPHIDPGDLGMTNPDPINAWQPGSVADQRHFAPEGSPSLGGVKYREAGQSMRRVTRELAEHPKPSPDREGPDYGQAGMNEPDVEDAFWIKLSLAPEAIPKRTEWILKNVVPTALRSFVRHNLQYRDTDEALGLQGQFAELFHITAKLKRQIWDRRNPESVTTGEVQEQLESLIGHALLSLDLLNKGNKDGN